MSREEQEAAIRRTVRSLDDAVQYARARADAAEARVAELEEALSNIQEAQDE